MEAQLPIAIVLLVIGSLVAVAIGAAAVRFLLRLSARSATSVSAYIPVAASIPAQPICRYERAAFLSPAERSFFGVLEQAVGEDHRVFAKVRLADIIRPSRNPSRSARQSEFNKIAAKHVDFLLCDPATLIATAVIELDDKSHNSLAAGFRDDFVNSALAGASIPILRVPARSSYAPNQLRDQLATIIPRASVPPPVPRTHTTTHQARQNAAPTPLPNIRPATNPIPASASTPWSQSRAVLDDSRYIPKPR
jgi:hypothetical protein